MAFDIGMMGGASLYSGYSGRFDAALRRTVGSAAQGESIARPGFFGGFDTFSRGSGFLEAMREMIGSLDTFIAPGVGRFAVNASSFLAARQIAPMSFDAPPPAADAPTQGSPTQGPQSNVNVTSRNGAGKKGEMAGEEKNSILKSLQDEKKYSPREAEALLDSATDETDGSASAARRFLMGIPERNKKNFHAVFSRWYLGQKYRLSSSEAGRVAARSLGEDQYVKVEYKEYSTDKKGNYHLYTIKETKGNTAQAAVKDAREQTLFRDRDKDQWFMIQGEKRVDLSPLDYNPVQKRLVFNFSRRELKRLSDQPLEIISSLETYMRKGYPKRKEAMEEEAKMLSEKEKESP